MNPFMSAVPRPKSLPSRFLDLERIARPVLSVDRHDIGMARQHDPAGCVRSEGGEQIGLAAGASLGCAGSARRRLPAISGAKSIRARLELRLVVSMATSFSTSPAIAARRPCAQPSKFEAGLPITLRNSRRVSGFLRNSPSMDDVTM
jgi:hypothetical protein